MIDLIKNYLPNTVEVNGRFFSIYTDYRIWLKFSILLKSWDGKSDLDFRFIFKNDMPMIKDEEDLKGIFNFFANPNELPKCSTSDNTNVLDYEIDSEFIYSAFLQQYNIDLIDVENLHWHKFKALLGGISDQTRLSAIMGYRCYDGNDKDYNKLKFAWELPRIYTEQEKIEMEKFENLFN